MANSEDGKPSDGGLKAQLKRLTAYRGYEDLKYDLLRVLRSHAASDEHAERIVTKVLDTRRPNENGFITCPTPAEMIDYAGEVPANPKQRKVADQNCSMCGGSGWRIIERRGLSAAETCACTCP